MATIFETFYDDFTGWTFYNGELSEGVEGIGCSGGRAGTCISGTMQKTIDTSGLQPAFAGSYTSVTWRDQFAFKAVPFSSALDEYFIANFGDVFNGAGIGANVPFSVVVVYYTDGTIGLRFNSPTTRFLSVPGALPSDGTLHGLQVSIELASPSVCNFEIAVDNVVVLSDTFTPSAIGIGPGNEWGANIAGPTFVGTAHIRTWTVFNLKTTRHDIQTFHAHTLLVDSATIADYPVCDASGFGIPPSAATVTVASFSGDHSQISIVGTNFRESPFAMEVIVSAPTGALNVVDSFTVDSPTHITVTVNPDFVFVEGDYAITVRNVPECYEFEDVPNAVCGDAIDICYPSNITRNVEMAGNNIDDNTDCPSCANDCDDRRFINWWTFTPEASGRVEVDTLNSDFDTLLSAWSGTCGSLVEVACDEDNSWALDDQSAIQFDVVEGTQYWIQVSSAFPFGSPGHTLVLRTTFVDSTDQPTFDEVLARHPEIVFTWAALSAPAYGGDVVSFVHGSNYVFFAEAFDNSLTGASEPDWDSAPNPGDTIVDGDITWFNGGLWSAFPAAPSTRQASHDYSGANSVPTFVWPATPNGHLYVAYPNYFGSSGVSVPDFQVVLGAYASDGAGYWSDLGTSGLTGTSCGDFHFDSSVEGVSIDCSIAIEAPPPIPSLGANQWRLQRFDAKIRGEQTA